MKNRTYIRYSRIFPTVAWVKISRRISLPHYTVLLSLFLQFLWNPSLPTAVQSPITMNRAVFRDKPAQERTEKRFFIRMERTPSRGRNGRRRFRRASAAESAAANPIRGDHAPTVFAAKCRSPVWRERLAPAGEPSPAGAGRMGTDASLPIKSTWDQSHSVPVTVSRSTSRVS